MLKTDDLGLSHTYPDNHSLRQGMLTIHEAGELIRRAGLELGLIPKSEYPVKSRKTKSKKRYIDWVWCDRDSKEVIAAFEIEGADCPKGAVTKDLDSLGAIKCPFKIVFLYQARRGEVLPSRNHMQKSRAIKSRMIRVEYDVAMMDGGVEALMLEVGGSL